MKPVVVLLLLASLAANAVWWSRPAAPSHPASPADSSAELDRGLESSADPSRQPNPAAPVDLAAIALLKWAGLPTGDLQALADRLRERGVPPHIIAGIVGHFLEEEYRAKRNALRARMSPVRYWEGTRSSGPEDMALRAELRNLGREQRDRINALAGTEESFIDPQYIAYFRQRYGDLPAAKIEAIQSIEIDYSDLMNQVRTASQGLLLAEDREALALLEQERRKDYMAILTPAEFEEFELRASNTASQLRRNLDTMQPTEEEFRTIFRLQQPFDEKYLSSSTPRGPSYTAERQAAERELVAAVKAALGPERGAEYEKSRDYNYVHAHMVAKNLGLPKDTGDRLWNVQKDALQQFNRLGTDSTLSAVEKARRQQEYVQSVRAAIAAEVGAENLPTYEQGGGGWLRSLEAAANRSLNRPPPPTAPPAR